MSQQTDPKPICHHHWHEVEKVHGSYLHCCHCGETRMTGAYD